jgi:integrase
LWTLPETKNGKRHTVHLNDLALRQFEALRQHTGLTEWVFPASRLNGPVCPKTVTKQVADRQRGDGEPMSGRSKQTDSLALAGGQWRPHDLRRTGATLMAELGVLPEVIERCLNHTEQTKVKRIYQRAQYEAPMREAWQKLGERLELLKNKPVNVVTLTRAA